ncbi:MAG: VTT domain-containing protein [Acidimicrobiales bacterium]|nr:VTT domain-containing protein [Acidimicrobiales bacterium]
MLSMILASGPWKPEFWLEKAGASAPWVIVAIIFAESGLFFGFFLPGDSLLFMAGFLTSSGAKEFVAPGAAGEALAPVVEGMPHIAVLLPLLFIAAVAGDQVGYLFGRKVGPALFTREDSRFFKQSHVAKAHSFLEKHGPKTIFLARFVPIVRTFAPIVAGVGEMKYRTFITYNLIGGFVWAVGITTLGHFLGNVAFVRDNIEYAIIVIVLLSLTPVFFELYQARKHAKAAHADSATTTS